LLALSVAERRLARSAESGERSARDSSLRAIERWIRPGGRQLGAGAFPQLDKPRDIVDGDHSHPGSTARTA
jgi:hypothetical protein